MHAHSAETFLRVYWSLWIELHVIYSTIEFIQANGEFVSFLWLINSTGWLHELHFDELGYTFVDWHNECVQHYTWKERTKDRRKKNLLPFILSLKIRSRFYVPFISYNKSEVTKKRNPMIKLNIAGNKEFIKKNMKKTQFRINFRQ